MIEFVNAKINIGLQIVEKRPDGYHNLQTVFYPIGKYAGTPVNPERFCDLLEITASVEGEPEFIFSGRVIDCPPEKNLVCKAYRLYAAERGAATGIRLRLEKNLPDGAGMGGGSADAAFALRMLADMEYARTGQGPGKEELIRMAASLGADCAFFIENRPVYAEGIGDIMSPVALNLDGFWAAVVKPRVFISTKEAFAGVKPEKSEVDLRQAVTLPPEEWEGVVTNDFEKSIFPGHPELAAVKSRLQKSGASYASMSGSGSSIYALFREREAAAAALRQFEDEATIEGTYLLKM